MSDILASLALGAGAGIAGAGLSYFGNKSLAEQQQRYYRENAKMEYALGQNAQVSSPSNIKRGLVMAGMNPALASEGKFSPASQGNAPLGATPHFDASIVGQNLLAVAEARKASAEATSIDIDNKNKRDANSTADEVMSRYYEDLAHKFPDGSEKYNYYMSRAEQVGSVGAVMGLAESLKAIDADMLTDVHKLSYRVDKAISEVRMSSYQQGDDTDIIKAMADIPRWTRNKDIQFIRESAQRIENLVAEGKILESDLKLTDAEIEQLKATAEHIRNSDINSLIKNKDYTGALVALVTLVLEALAGGSSRYIPNRSVSSKK